MAMLTIKATCSCSSRRSTKSAWRLVILVLLLSFSGGVLASDDYYAADDDAKNYNYNKNYNNKNYQSNNNYNNYYNNANGDDGGNANYNNGDDQYSSSSSYNNTNSSSSSSSSSSYNKNSNKNSASNYYATYQDDWAANNADVIDDDLFHWNSNVGFDGISIMPVSCVNYNNGHMIKFEFFESEASYQCHFAHVGTFVVSIAHYMRAYFNHQALVYGQDFELPGDVGYLNCVQVQQTADSNEPLYAKIGCMERETFTSTKLALHLYTDQTCSTPYNDGYSSRRHSAKGYDLKGNLISSHVSFRPPFYACETCKPEEISETFNKRAGTWYDDDYIAEHGEARDDGEEDREDDRGDNDDGAGDDGGNKNKYYDDYYQDDGYLAANDDVNNYGNRRLDAEAMVRVEPPVQKLIPVQEQYEAFEKEFWASIQLQKKRQRGLYENDYDIDDWNMCQRVYKYGMWCDEECRSLDAFRTDRWSSADMILLSIMCTFLTAMMLLIVAKRLKAAQKSRMYHQDDVPMPGLPPVAMLSIYVVIITAIVVMAKLKFVNETLVFAVVTCLLLFIYMLKLTLFDNRRPVLLAAARHGDLFDNPMDERLFD